jgi:hypothetical protein
MSMTTYGYDYQHFGNRYWSRYSSKNAMNRINAADREKQ